MFATLRWVGLPLDNGANPDEGQAMRTVELPGRSKVAPAKAPWFWPAVAILIVYGAFRLGSPWVDMSSLVRFASRMGALALGALALSIWWFANRHLPRGHRL